jgi:hypothetical protein
VSTRSAWSIISGPMPSPGSTEILCALHTTRHVLRLQKASKSVSSGGAVALQ